MPNWCNNTLTISHADPAMAQKAADAWNSGRFLQTLVPCPQELFDTVAGFASGDEGKENKRKEIANLKKYGYKNWYDYCIDEWGTKWDIGYDEDLDNKAELIMGEFEVMFDSAWSPPTGAYQKLLDMGFKIKAYYFEPGMAYCGKWENGEDEYYDLSKAKLEDIPRDIQYGAGVIDYYQMMGESAE